MIHFFPFSLFSLIFNSLVFDLWSSHSFIFLAILEKKRRYTHTLVIWYVDGLPVTNLSLYYYTSSFSFMTSCIVCFSP